uniref:Uncharacterized protein n=1 Tax=Arundo donax TaxID=35708 RepID=A0A0A9BHM4_ARUDO
MNNFGVGPHSRMFYHSIMLNLSGIHTIASYFLVLTRGCTCPLLFVCCGFSSLGTELFLSETVLLLGVLFITTTIAYPLLTLAA